LIPLATFEYSLGGGWWLLAEILIAEMKCKRPEDYEEYCLQFVTYLERYMTNPSLARKDGLVHAKTVPA